MSTEHWLDLDAAAAKLVDIPPRQVRAAKSAPSLPAGLGRGYHFAQRQRLDLDPKASHSTARRASFPVTDLLKELDPSRHQLVAAYVLSHDLLLPGRARL